VVVYKNTIRHTFARMERQEYAAIKMLKIELVDVSHLNRDYVQLASHLINSIIFIVLRIKVYVVPNN